MNLPEWASLHHRRVQDKERKLLPKISRKDSPYRLKKKQAEMILVPAEAVKNSKNAVGNQVNKIL